MVSGGVSWFCVRFGGSLVLCVNCGCGWSPWVSSAAGLAGAPRFAAVGWCPAAFTPLEFPCPVPCATPAKEIAPIVLVQASQIVPESCVFYCGFGAQFHAMLEEVRQLSCVATESWCPRVLAGNACTLFPTAPGLCEALAASFNQSPLHNMTLAGSPGSLAP